MATTCFGPLLAIIRHIVQKLKEGVNVASIIILKGKVVFDWKN
jgi:hypothetical protein